MNIIELGEITKYYFFLTINILDTQKDKIKYKVFVDKTFMVYIFMVKLNNFFGVLSRCATFTIQ